MATKLTVPLVKQQQTMECWYAAVCMVAYYRRPGPRLGLPDKWETNAGINRAEFSTLARAEGLKSFLTPASELTSQQLEVFLKNYGPIWCAGKWDGFPHIVVLTGVDGDTVYISDPDQGERQETLAWFNLKRTRGHDCMMYMPE